MSQSPEITAQIAHLNDVLRTTFTTGTVLATEGIRALSIADRAAIRMAVESFDDFSEDNDPYGEHDFGAFTHKGHKVFWKINYYDQSMQWASPDPTDPLRTHRVLTIMLASEY